MGRLNCCRRDVVVFHEDTTECNDPALSSVVLCKLFKESKGSQYWEWRKQALESGSIDIVGM